MTEEKTFNCPNCGGPLQVSGDTPTIECPYCESSVVVPESMRRKPQVTPVATVSVSQEVHKAGQAVRRGGCLAVVLGIVILLTVVGFLVVIPVARREGGAGISIEVNETTGSIEVARPEEKDAGLAQVAFSFGREGIGPGQFSDARYIGVDGAGNIYVAEHEEGSRVQLFDSGGHFVTLWTPQNTDAYVIGLDAGRQGTVYLVQQGDIDRYDGQTGEFLGKTTGLGIGAGFDDVVIAPDGGFVAAGSRVLARYSSDAELLWSVDEPIESQTGDSELSPQVAVDGLGNIYVLGSFHSAVFKFSPEGKFLDQFGGDGDGPGQFRAPNAIAVDGQGRVYVGDIKGIQVFDASGRYVGLVEVDGFPFGLAFNDDDELFVASRDKVIKYLLND